MMAASGLPSNWQRRGAGNEQSETGQHHDSMQYDGTGAAAMHVQQRTEMPGIAVRAFVMRFVVSAYSLARAK